MKSRFPLSGQKLHWTIEGGQIEFWSKYHDGFCTLGQFSESSEQFYYEEAVLQNPLLLWGFRDFGNKTIFSALFLENR